MNEVIEKLIELQTLDLRAAGLRRQIDAFPELLARIDLSVGDAREHVLQAKLRVQDLQKVRRKVELDVDDWRDKLRKYKDQVYQLKSNEAYKAMQEEIRDAETELRRAEDRLLEQMVGAEDAERAVKEVESGLAQAEAAGRAERERVEKEKADLVAEHARLEAASKGLLAALPGDLVDHYRRIARRHEGVALSPVRGEACSMCRVRIRPHVVQLLSRPDNQEIFHCETCTRILYYAEKPAPAEGTQQPSVAEAGSY